MPPTPPTPPVSAYVPPPGVTVFPMYPMYSPGQITAATFLGTPLGGAWLLATNYRRLREPRKARIAIGLGVLATAGLLAVAWLLDAPSSLAIGSVIAMSALAKRLQGAAYDHHVSLAAPRASNWRAVGIGLASGAILAAVVVGGAMAYYVATAPAEIQFGTSSVRYTSPATKAEAQALGDALVELEYFTPSQTGTVQLTRDHDRRIVAFVVQDVAFTDEAIQREFREIAQRLSSKAFAQAPVDVWLTDDELEPHAKLTWEHRPDHDGHERRP